MKRITPDPIKIGDRIELVHMPDDPDPIPYGTKGTVDHVANLSFMEPGQIQLGVKWDNGRTLSLIAPPDVFRLIHE